MAKCKDCHKDFWAFGGEERCIACHKKDRYAGIKEEITSGELDRTDCEDDIICPWCGEVYDDPEDGNKYMEGEYEYHCHECDRDFWCDVYCIYSYSTTRK